MKKSTARNAVRAIAPYGKLLADVVQTASRNVRDAAVLLGQSHKTERANDMHRAIRNTFDAFCPMTNGMFKLREAKRGLDYVVFSGDVEFALRWGHQVGGSIRRNGTFQTMNMHDQGILSDDWGIEKTINELLVLTIAFTLRDEFTLAGKPQWYVDRVTLIREQADSSDTLAELKQYSQPCNSVWFEDPQPVIVARKDDTQRWKKQLGSISRAG